MPDLGLALWIFIIACAVGWSVWKGSQMTRLEREAEEERIERDKEF